MKDMQPYFERESASELLQSALHKRKGLPFRNGMGSLTGGYDCWHLVLDCYIEVGIDVSVLGDPPQGSLNWGRFHDWSLILHFLKSDEACRRHLRFADETAPLMAGDLVAIREGVSQNHLGIADGRGFVWHVPRGGTVGPVSEKMLRHEKQLHSAFRIHS